MAPKVVLFAGISMYIMAWVMMIGGYPSSTNKDYAAILKAMEFMTLILLIIGFIITGAAWKYVFNTPNTANATKTDETAKQHAESAQ